MISRKKKYSEYFLKKKKRIKRKKKEKKKKGNTVLVYFRNEEVLLFIEKERQVKETALTRYFLLMLKILLHEDNTVQENLRKFCKLGLLGLNRFQITIGFETFIFHL